MRAHQVVQQVMGDPCGDAKDVRQGLGRHPDSEKNRFKKKVLEAQVPFVCQQVLQVIVHEESANVLGENVVLTDEGDQLQGFHLFNVRHEDDPHAHVQGSHEFLQQHPIHIQRGLGTLQQQFHVQQGQRLSETVRGLSQSILTGTNLAIRVSVGAHPDEEVTTTVEVYGDQRVHGDKAEKSSLANTAKLTKVTYGTGMLSNHDIPSPVENELIELAEILQTPPTCENYIKVAAEVVQECHTHIMMRVNKNKSANQARISKTKTKSTTKLPEFTFPELKAVKSDGVLGGSDTEGGQKSATKAALVVTGSRMTEVERFEGLDIFTEQGGSNQSLGSTGNSSLDAASLSGGQVEAYQVTDASLTVPTLSIFALRDNASWQEVSWVTKEEIETTEQSEVDMDKLTEVERLGHELVEVLRDILRKEELGPEVHSDCVEQEVQIDDQKVEEEFVDDMQHVQHDALVGEKRDMFVHVVLRILLLQKHATGHDGEAGAGLVLVLNRLLVHTARGIVINRHHEAGVRKDPQEVPRQAGGVGGCDDLQAGQQHDHRNDQARVRIVTREMSGSVPCHVQRQDDDDLGLVFLCIEGPGSVVKNEGFLIVSADIFTIEIVATIVHKFCQVVENCEDPRHVSHQSDGEAVQYELIGDCGDPHHGRHHKARVRKDPQEVPHQAVRAEVRKDLQNLHSQKQEVFVRQNGELGVLFSGHEYHNHGALDGVQVLPGQVVQAQLNVQTPQHYPGLVVPAAPLLTQHLGAHVTFDQIGCGESASLLHRLHCLDGGCLQQDQHLTDQEKVDWKSSFSRLCLRRMAENSMEDTPATTMVIMIVVQTGGMIFSHFSFITSLRKALIRKIVCWLFVGAHHPEDVVHGVRDQRQHAIAQPLVRGLSQGQHSQRGGEEQIVNSQVSQQEGLLLFQDVSGQHPRQLHVLHQEIYTGNIVTSEIEMYFVYHEDYTVPHTFCDSEENTNTELNMEGAGQFPEVHDDEQGCLRHGVRGEGPEAGGDTHQSVAGQQPELYYETCLRDDGLISHLDDVGTANGRQQLGLSQDHNPHLVNNGEDHCSHGAGQAVPLNIQEFLEFGQVHLKLNIKLINFPEDGSVGVRQGHDHSQRDAHFSQLQ